MDPTKHPPVSPQRASRAQGIRFERAVCEAFRIAGFSATRTDERDGYVRGWDVFVEELPHMAVQCKATGNKGSLLRGLEEARRHNPKARLWVCFHSWRRSGRRPQLRVAYSSRLSGPPSITSVRDFLTVLVRAHVRGKELDA